MNPLLAAPDEATFRTALLGGLGAYPTYYEAMAPTQPRRTASCWAGPAAPPPLDAAGFRAALAPGAHVVDGRSRAEFAAGHLPGSLNIELDDSFASYVGWFVPFGARRRARPARAARRGASTRRRSSCSASATTGSTACSRAASRAGRTPAVRTLESLPDDDGRGAPRTGRSPAANGYALDVRDPNEWREDGVVPGAHPDPARRPGRPAGLDPARRPDHGHVQVGSARVASRRACSTPPAVDVRLIARGGAPDWPDDRAPLPVDPDAAPLTTPPATRSRHHARRLDAADPSPAYRDRFLLPTRAPTARPKVYLAGQSLGAQPAAARAAVEAELEAWAHARRRWLVRQGRRLARGRRRDLRESTARLVGARPDEVATLNTLTVNLHLLLATFFRPAGARTAILIDAPTFPSDRYAVESQLRLARARPGERPHRRPATRRRGR